MLIREYPIEREFTENDFAIKLTQLKLGNDILTPSASQASRQKLPRLSIENEREIRISDKAIYVVGAIYYKDILGNEYETHYRWVCHGPDRMKSGSVGSDEFGNWMT